MRLPVCLGWLLFFVSLLAHICCEDVFGILGENFTFPVKIDQNIVEIIWTKNKDKVAEWEGQTNPTYFTSLQNRSLLNKENGQLTIFNLENNDAGTYVLDCLNSGEKNYVLTFILAVLAPPSEPEISCNISGNDMALKCTADFPKPLNYSWKFSSLPFTHQTQEIVIPKKNVPASEKAACFIKVSQMEKSCEISLTQCFPDKKGDSYGKRNRGGLIAAFILLIPVVGVLGFLYRRGRIKLGTGRAALKSSLLHGSATSSQAVDCENEKSEADEELNKENSALKDKQTVNRGVNQEEASAMQNSTLTSECAVNHGVTEGDTFKKENSSLLAKHAGDHGVNEGEVTQDAEGGNGEHLSNSPSFSKEERHLYSEAPAKARDE
ncbi:lymphocyte function-associated antigen 3 isoform X2 [Harpia harpyja]|uniref:lymphocyte function-associated antigen 3 isoform X2 n=1 Tax=Harpia harpyja TaxID=202280 RepID=UPI0022B1FB54|nr:lymphocyte function-associated antigen 3 isoform X2 [Harpia harpyja]